jgi:16S rRNA (uracil1498-N3)-methyltransferase
VRRDVRVQLVSRIEPATEAAVPLTLVQAVLKGDKMDDVVRDATMMGVAGVQPAIAARSEVSMAALSRSGRVSRWQRIAVASVKQCGRAVVPLVHPPVLLPDWMARPPAATVLVLAEPSTGAGQSFGDVPRGEAIDLVIGPEGGWTPEEQRGFSERGARFIALGGRTLRADAAPVVAMAALFEAWHAW